MPFYLPTQATPLHDGGSSAAEESESGDTSEGEEHEPADVEPAAFLSEMSLESPLLPDLAGATLAFTVKSGQGFRADMKLKAQGDLNLDAVRFVISAASAPRGSAIGPDGKFASRDEAHRASCMALFQHPVLAPHLKEAQEAWNHGRSFVLRHRNGGLLSVLEQRAYAHWLCSKVVSKCLVAEPAVFVLYFYLHSTAGYEQPDCSVVEVKPAWDCNGHVTVEGVASAATALVLPFQAAYAMSRSSNVVDHIGIAAKMVHSHARQLQAVHLAAASANALAEQVTAIRAAAAEAARAQDKRDRRLAVERAAAGLVEAHRASEIQMVENAVNRRFYMAALAKGMEHGIGAHNKWCAHSSCASLCVSIVLWL